MKCTPKVRQKSKTFGGAFFMAKKGQVFRKYSPEFKLSVILDMRENHLSYSETVRKYWHTKKKAETNSHRSQVKNWERKFLEEGYEGLMKDNRGKTSVNGKKRGRPPKLDKKVEEDLIAENQRLRMENEYLKKLRALVLAEERENGKKPR
jgi:hypothetical protein